MKTEIAFWDTSALVPLCCSQSGSTVRTRALLRRFGQPVIWWGTAVEIHSALSRLHEEETISDRELINSIKRWEAIESISREITPTEQVKRLARSLPGQYRIRSLDAFQLAAALAWCQEQPRRRPFICLDGRLAQAAEKAGFNVYPQ
ncbi:MAG: type II toxin-antitoxin system VapC family toxin [Acidobacteria bacterium]|nr:type II toxin-antitoxin system VapC family toxin [Acidobacteriota bacterium]